MANKLAYAAGVIGMAVLGVWMAVRRNRSVMGQLPAGSMTEVNDDDAAQLISMYKPALERALADSR